LLEVVTVWTPRPQSPQWRDYSELLALQARTVRRAGHRHVVVSDVALPQYEVLDTELPDSLMHALLAGPLAYFEEWTDDHPVVVLDMDCMVCRPLEAAFDGNWVMAFTSRELDQNGAMYFAPGSRRAAIELFSYALKVCRKGWGGDQEAIAKALHPVPMSQHGVQERLGVRVGFLGCELYNYTNKREFPDWSDERFVVHFKGDKKPWAKRFVEEMERRDAAAK
jgi:hypothetical protein